MEEEIKKKTAVALEYEKGDQAPRITASGHGFVAEKIIETAKSAKVPLHKDERLAETLSGLTIGESIPEELYSVVAEVLVMVDRAENKL